MIEPHPHVAVVVSSLFSFSRKIIQAMSDGIVFTEVDDAGIDEDIGAGSPAGIDRRDYLRLDFHPDLTYTAPSRPRLEPLGRGYHQSSSPRRNSAGSSHIKQVSGVPKMTTAMVSSTPPESNKSVNFQDEPSVVRRPSQPLIAYPCDRNIQPASRTSSLSGGPRRSSSTAPPSIKKSPSKTSQNSAIALPNVSPRTFLGGPPQGVPKHDETAGTIPLLPSEPTANLEPPGIKCGPNSHAVRAYLVRSDSDAGDDRDKLVLSEDMGYPKRKSNRKFDLFNIITSGRTERAVKFVLGLILACIVTFTTELQPRTTLLYLLPIAYACSAALTPPLAAALSVTWTLNFVGGLFAIGLITGVVALTVEAGHNGFSTRATMAVAGGIFFLTVVPFKVGQLSQLLMGVVLLATYIPVLSTLTIAELILDPLGFHIAYEDLVANKAQLAELITKALPPIPFIDILVNYLVAQIFAALEAGQSVIIPINIDDTAVADDPSIKYLKGLTGTLTLDKTNGLLLKTVPGQWITRFLWQGSGKNSLFQSNIAVTVVATGIASFVFLLPPLRQAKSVLRSRLCFLIKHVGLLTPWGNLATDTTCSPMCQIVRTIDPVGDYSLCEDQEEGKEADFELAHKGGGVWGKVKRRNPFKNLLVSPQASPNNRLLAIGAEEASVRRDLDSVRNADYLVIALPAAATDDDIQRDGGSSSPRSIAYGRISRNEEPMADAIELCAMESVMQSLIPLAMLEPSVSNPGPWTFSSMKWRPLLTELHSCYINVGSLRSLTQHPWDHLKDDSEEKQLEFSTLMARGREMVEVGRDIYDMSGVLVGLRAVSRGSQLSIVQHLRRKLRRLCEHQIDNRVAFVRDFPRSKMQKLVHDAPLQTKVDVFGSMEDFLLATSDCPVKLAIAVDDLIAAQTNQSFKGLLLSICGWLSPMFILFALLIKNVVQYFIFWKWQWRRRHPMYTASGKCFFKDMNFIFMAKFVIGIWGLFAGCVAWDAYRTWIVSGKNGYILAKLAPFILFRLSGKVAAWTCLGFIVCFYQTAEGTVKRAFLRFAGVLLGSFSAWLGLLICKHTPFWLTFWVAITTFVAVWLSANSSNPLLGFHPSYGYTFQLFTYQQMLIVSETYFSQQSTDELIVARITGQAVGITIALIFAFIFPSKSQSLNVDCLVQALHCTTRAAQLVLETTAASNEPIDLKRTSLEECSRVVTNFPRSMEKIVKSKLKKVEKVSKKTVLGEAAKAFIADAEEALLRMAAVIRDGKILAELPIFIVENKWKRVHASVRLMLYRLQAFQDIISEFQDVISYEDIIGFASELGQFSDRVEKGLAYNNGSLRNYVHRITGLGKSPKAWTAFINSVYAPSAIKWNQRFENLSTPFLRSLEITPEANQVSLPTDVRHAFLVVRYLAQFSEDYGRVCVSLVNIFSLNSSVAWPAPVF